jgi:hypothetical protein
MERSANISKLEKDGLTKWLAASRLVQALQERGETITLQEAYNSIWITPAGSRRYIRLPDAGELCPFSALSRSKLNELILPTDEQPNPPVKSIVLPNLAGNKRGCRLIVLESLMNYLRALEEEESPPERRAA